MLLLMPEILISTCIILLLIILCLTPNKHSTKLVCTLAYILILFGAYFILISACSTIYIPKTIFYDNYLLDKITYALKGFLIFGSGILILYSKSYLLQYNIFK